MSDAQLIINLIHSGAILLLSLAVVAVALRR